MAQNKKLRQKTFSFPQMKSVRILMVVGFATAVFLSVVANYLNPEIPMHREALKLLARVSIWVWPSAIMMMVDSANPLVAIVILLISAIINSFFYGLIGFAIGTIWNNLRKKK